MPTFGAGIFLICAAWENDGGERVDLHDISHVCECEFGLGLEAALGGNALRGDSRSNAELYIVLLVDYAGSGVYVAGGRCVRMALAVIVIVLATVKLDQPWGPAIRGDYCPL